MNDSSQRPWNRLPEFARHIGLEMIEASQQHVVGRIQLGPQHSNGRGVVHGGVIMSLADTLGAIGAVLNLPPGAVTTTLESKTNFLAAGRGAELIGESVPLHIGRNTMVWQTTIRDAAERRIAVVTQTQLVLQLDQSSSAHAARVASSPNAAYDTQPGIEGEVGQC